MIMLKQRIIYIPVLCGIILCTVVVKWKVSHNLNLRSVKFSAG